MDELDRDTPPGLIPGMMLWEREQVFNVDGIEMPETPMFPCDAPDTTENAWTPFQDDELSAGIVEWVRIMHFTDWPPWPDNYNWQTNPDTGLEEPRTP